MLVKICGLSTREHVEVAVAAGADAIGFVFAESVRRVTPAHAASITHSVPDTVRKVAVMLHPSNAEWQQVLVGFGPDVLQTDSGDFARLEVPGHVECWPVFRQGKKVADPFFPGLKGSATFLTGTFLYEGARSGQGKTVDWTEAARIARRGNMILAGGLDASNVAEAVRTVRPCGVDVSSGVEAAPGAKSAEKIREFIKAARAAENDQ